MLNKEEIRKRIKVVESDECDKCYFPKKRSCRSCIKQSYKEIKRYIKHLEQKESILDKVTDKLKEDIPEAKEKIKYWEEQYRISKAKKDEFYKNSYKRQINKWHSRFETLREIENIIEGEKNKLNSIKQY